MTLEQVGAPNQRAPFGMHDGVVCRSTSAGCSRVVIKVSKNCKNRLIGFPIHRAGFALTICPRELSRAVKTSHRGERRTRRFAMHTDPSVLLCMLSRALRSLPLVSERPLPLWPTCTFFFFFSFFINKVNLNVDPILRCHWASRELYILDTYKVQFCGVGTPNKSPPPAH